MPTSTHTHVVTELANPYLRCEECEKPIEGIVSFEGQVRGCTHHGENVPCGHLSMISICPSWSPVNGCRCKEQLGKVSHDI